MVINNKKVIILISSLLFIVVLAVFVFRNSSNGSTVNNSVSNTVNDFKVDMNNYNVASVFIDYRSKIVPLTFKYPNKWFVDEEVIYDLDYVKRYRVTVNDGSTFSMSFDYLNFIDKTDIDTSLEEFQYFQDEFNILFDSKNLTQLNNNLYVSDKGGYTIYNNELEVSDVNSKVLYNIFQIKDNKIYGNTNLFFDSSINPGEMLNFTRVTYSFDSPAANLNWTLYKPIIKSILESAKYEVYSDISA